jgi:hypothetical protein
VAFLAADACSIIIVCVKNGLKRVYQPFFEFRVEQAMNDNDVWTP